MTLTEVGGTLRFDVTIRREFAGTSGIDLEALNGQILLDGSIDLIADVDLHLVFGVDSGGFFIDPNAVAGPELVISNIRMEGVEAFGKLGFLEVEATSAELQIADGVRLETDLINPGAICGRAWMTG